MTDFEAEFGRLCEFSAAGRAQDILESIRRFNLNVNQANSRGWTPLHFAARFGLFSFFVMYTS